VVAIPQEQRWAGRDWETWLAVTSESSDMLAVKLYVRLLVSTGGTRFSPGLVAGIAVAVVLLGFGGYYYFRRRARPE
jgi:LPXTG-motif cell wall-anchored protein